MLSELESGLVACLKASALAARLRQIEALPNLDDDSLIGRFATDAPAVYVALGAVPVSGGAARPKFGVACVAKNSRSPQAARHGDGVAIGLYEMLDAVMTVLDGAVIDAGDAPVSIEVLSCEGVIGEKLYARGLHVGVVHLQTAVEVRWPTMLDEEGLAAFQTFHADTDIDAQAGAAEHAKWLQEPPDYRTSGPGLTDTLSLPQE